jgi:hypothetical protein
MGFRGPVARNTLAVANEKRDWRIYADFAQVLIHQARKLYADDDLLGSELDQSVYALDSTTIDLCLKLFPWADFGEGRAAIKLHTLLDLRGNIPAFIHVSRARMHDVRILDQLIPEPGAIYVFDRGYLDFTRFRKLTSSRAIFVTRARKSLKFRRRYSHPVDRSTGLICDQTVILTGPVSFTAYPEPLRRIRYRDPEGRNLVFLTNEFSLPAIMIANLYRSRWQIENFFRWIKQHLRIKAFYGTTENAVKVQIWSAISSYLLVAIMNKHLGIEKSLYEILQILSVTLFEKTQAKQAFSQSNHTPAIGADRNQLLLFNL